MKRFRLTTYCGLALWILLPMIGWQVFTANISTRDTFDGTQRLWKYWRQRPVTHLAVLEDRVLLNYRDSIFIFDSENNPQRVGHVVSPTSYGAPVGTQVRVLFYGTEQPWQTGRLELHRPNRNLARVVEVMMTEERLARLNEILLTARRHHEAELATELTPIIQRAFVELRPIMEDEIRQAIADHQPQLEQLSDRYQAKIVKQRLVPLVEKEILPVIQKHASPLLEKIGGKMWQKVSLWRFGWRYVYDGSVGPSEKLVQQEWSRFVQQHAVPILKSHSDDFVALQAAIIKELAENPEVTQAIRDSLGEVFRDEDVWQVSRSIMAQGITHNPRVEQKLRQIMQSPETQRRLSRIGDQLEPYAVSIGQELFGSPQEVNKEFALVLRHMILQKDEQWLVWVPDITTGEPANDPPRESTDRPLPLFWAPELGTPPFFIHSPEDRFELTSRELTSHELTSHESTLHESTRESQ